MYEETIYMNELSSVYGRMIIPLKNIKNLDNKTSLIWRFFVYGLYNPICIFINNEKYEICHQLISSELIKSKIMIYQGKFNLMAYFDDKMLNKVSIYCMDNNVVMNYYKESCKKNAEKLYFFLDKKWN